MRNNYPMLLVCLTTVFLYSGLLVCSSEKNKENKPCSFVVNTFIEVPTKSLPKGYKYRRMVINNGERFLVFKNSSESYRLWNIDTQQFSKLSPEQLTAYTSIARQSGYFLSLADRHHYKPSTSDKVHGFRLSEKYRLTVT